MDSIEEQEQCAVRGCERVAETYTVYMLEVPLCQPHIYDFSSKSKERMNEIAAEFVSLNPDVRHSDGYCYVVRMGSGTVKIGTTKFQDMRRLTEISKSNNLGTPVHVIAIVKGGVTLEAALHDQWKSLKVPGRSEEYYADPSLLEWANQLGVNPFAEVERYDKWIEGRHSRGSVGKYAREMWGDINQEIEDLQMESLTLAAQELLQSIMKEG